MDVLQVVLQGGCGVNTTHVVGVGNVEVYNGSGDYLIAVESTDTIDSIVSRWFIIEASRNCKGQFGLTLRRDLVVDNFSQGLRRTHEIPSRDLAA